MRICFVCYANACRSPLAEYLFTDMVKEAGLEDQYEVQSRGMTDVAAGNYVLPPIQQQLLAHGFGPCGHKATPLVPEDYAYYDMLVGMDEINISGMKEIFGGDPDHKLFKLLSFKGEDRDVADPWHTDDFETAWIDVYDGCLALFKKLTEKAE